MFYWEKFKEIFINEKFCLETKHLLELSEKKLRGNIIQIVHQQVNGPLTMAYVPSGSIDP